MNHEQRTMNPSVDLTICVLSYNTRDVLRRCLASIKGITKGISYELIVVDNASADGSGTMVCTEFPEAVLIENQENRWFSGGNNQAFSRANGRYVAFMNSDVWIEDDALSSLVAWLDRHPSVVAVEPRQVADDGRVAPTGSLLNHPLVDAIELTGFNRWFASHPSVERFRRRRLDRKKNWKTEAISGAAIIARSDAVRRVGGFDEGLKLYYTDIDLCRKLSNIGQIWHLGHIGVRHSQSRSTARLSWWTRSGIYVRDAFVYYWMTDRRIAAVLLWFLLQVNRVLVQVKLMVAT